MSEKKKEFLKFCNTLRCPLCNGQLDGNVHEKEAKLYCVNDNSEYKCTWRPGETDPFYEKITYYYSQYKYEVISQKAGSSTFDVKVDRLTTGYTSMHLEASRKRVFDHYGDRLLFFRDRMEENVFLKKLKLYNIFC
jgi:hypothetical protein